MFVKKFLINMIIILTLVNRAEAINHSIEKKSDLVKHFDRNHKIRFNKKNNFFSICSLFKDESEFLKEWIEYHLLIGVDHFYLYNLESSDSCKEVLSDYINRKIVTLIDWPDYINNQSTIDFEILPYLWPLSTQVTAFENAVQYRALKETEWLVILDINEYLVFPDAVRIHDVLEKYREFPGIVLPCDYFDVSARNTIPKKKLLIETLELVKAPQYNPHHCVTKAIFKPEKCQGFTWPPYKVQFNDQQHAIAVSKREMRINHYVNRTGNLFAPIANIASVDNRFLSDEERNDLLDLGYHIEDRDRPIYRFIPELLVRLSYDPLSGW